jgi:hypothetical protein
MSFRAQLRIPEQRQLFDYWARRCGVRSMPSRSDIAPAEIAGLLPYLGLVDVESRFGESMVRLAGTALRDIYGIELTGKTLGDIEWGDKGAYWRGVYRRLTDGRVPLHGIIRGPIAGREHVTLCWMRLPLSDDGGSVNKALCCDVAVTAPASQRPVERDVALQFCYA